MRPQLTSREIGPAVLSSMRLTLQGVVATMDIASFPPAKAIAVAALQIVNIAEGVRKNKEDMQDLSIYIGNITEAILRELGGKCDNDITTDMKCQIDLLSRELFIVLKSMKRLSSRVWLLRALNHSEDALTIAAFTMRIQSVLNVFNIGSAIAQRLQTERIESGVTACRDAIMAHNEFVRVVCDHVLDKDTLDLLDRLPNAIGATHSTEQECLGGTRVDILRRINDWVWDIRAESQTVFWLGGLAGSGKSTVAATMAHQLEEKQLLGAHFFFCRQETDRNKSALVFSTLARQLAVFRKGEFGSWVANAVRGELDVGISPPANQFLKLIVQPLLQANISDNPTVFIFDAVDECDVSSAEEILSSIRRYLPQLPPNVKFMITSRALPHIHAEFDAMGHYVWHHSFNNDSRSAADVDLAAYIKECLPNRLKSYAWMDPDWPGEEHRAALVRMADGLFIWLKTAILFISDPNQRDPKRQLSILLDSPSSLTQIHSLYTRVLIEAFPTTVQPPVIKLFQDIVGALIVLQNPLNIHALASLIHLERYQLQDTLMFLQSVLIIHGLKDPQAHDSGIRFIHPSFLEYLSSKQHCSDSRLYIRTDTHHRHLALYCFDQLYDVPTVFALSADRRHEAGDRKALPPMGIPMAMQYACRFWSHHLVEVASPDEDLLHQVDTFCRNYILMWLEAMHALGYQQDALSILVVTRDWINKTHQFPHDTYELLSHCIQVESGFVVGAAGETGRGVG